MDIDLQQLPQQLVNGLTLGGVDADRHRLYHGLTVFSPMLNFAHGEVLMIGASISDGGSSIS